MGGELKDITHVVGLGDELHPAQKYDFFGVEGFLTGRAIAVYLKKPVGNNLKIHPERKGRHIFLSANLGFKMLVFRDVFN